MRSELDTIDHVLRGALNTVLLNLQLVATAPERDDQTRALLDRASSGLRRLASELLPAVFGVLRLEVGAREPVDLGLLVDAARAKHGLAGAVRPGPSVVGDPDLLAVAVEHLIANAVAATPPGAPEPHIGCDVAGGSVALVVRNACAGEPPPLTADGIPATRGHLGGLVAVMRIARLHGGSLSYERRVGEICARFSIPAAPGSSPAAGRTEGDQTR